MTSKASQVDQDLIRTIAELLNEQNLAEIEIEREDFRVRVTRSFANNVVQAPQVYAAQAATHAPAATSASAAVAAATSTPAEDLASNPGTLTSPMVGTAYSAPEPGASKFVTVGQKVSEGQTVLIIEAMKTMNQIPAHRSGTIARILFEDAQPIEYGQPLVVIE
jgi:acetyl-CoA carboxylase biotin carboxyl carrier protein